MELTELKFQAKYSDGTRDTGPLMQLRIFQIAFLSAAAMLASGCYCPMLSGRYCDYRGFPPGLPNNCVAPDANELNYAPCGPPHCCGLSMLFPGLAGGMGGNNSVPSQQGPDYSSPLAKFHPVPTRPVFEPMPAHPPTELIEPGISNPLRSHTATIATARAAKLR
jgi:hypothetical protein